MKILWVREPLRYMIIGIYIIMIRCLFVYWGLRARRQRGHDQVLGIIVAAYYYGVPCRLYVTLAQGSQLD